MEGKFKRISNITTLTGDILGIAAQTNLLALNASIEAARAGEAERALQWWPMKSGSLRTTARRQPITYREISQSVVKGVSDLSENASGLLQFVNERVMSDYDELENTYDTVSEGCH